MTHFGTDRGSRKLSAIFTEASHQYQALFEKWSNLLTRTEHSIAQLRSLAATTTERPPRSLWEMLPASWFTTKGVQS